MNVTIKKEGPEVVAVLANEQRPQPVVIARFYWWEGDTLHRSLMRWTLAQTFKRAIDSWDVSNRETFTWRKRIQILLTGKL